VIKVTIVAVALVGAGVLAPAPARAEVSAACWAHLAGVETANTPAADRRYHLERGEPSPCTEYDANDNYGPYQQRQEQKRRDDPPREERKHYDSPGYGCKLTFTGYHCG
jgi:hypothetical protein